MDAIFLPSRRALLPDAVSSAGERCPSTGVDRAPARGEDGSQVMAASSFVLLLSLATVGTGGDGAGVGRVVGVVVGPDGRPAAGAEVMAAGGEWDGNPPSSIGRAKADG